MRYRIRRESVADSEIGYCLEVWREEEIQGCIRWRMIAIWWEGAWEVTHEEELEDAVTPPYFRKRPGTLYRSGDKLSEAHPELALLLMEIDGVH